MKIKILSKKIVLIFITLILLLSILNISYAESINITATASILIDSKTGQVLYQKNAFEKRYPASTTKIMTAILAIEKCNLSDKVTASSSALKNIPSGYVTAYTKEGETMTIEEYLQLYLVHSANEVGFVLAEHISGSVSEFAKLMNQKALEIGCKNTNFTNPSGLHDVNHYTTAYDLSLIAQYCMKNDTFRNIVKMDSCTIKATNKSGERKYPSTNELIIPTSQYYNKNIIGIKTGYTSQAGNCLISAYKNEEIELISVVLGSKDSDANKKIARFTDTLKVFDYGINNYSFQYIFKKDDTIKTIDIENASSDTKKLNIVLEEDIFGYFNNSLDKSVLEPTITLNDNIQAPISKGTVLGNVSYTINDLTYTTNIVAANDVKLSFFKTALFKLMIIAIIIILLFILLVAVSKKRKNKKRKKYKKNKYMYY